MGTVIGLNLPRRYFLKTSVVGCGVLWCAALGSSEGRKESDEKIGAAPVAPQGKHEYEYDV